MLNIHAKGLLYVIAACIPVFMYHSRHEDSFSITEGSRVQLSDRAFLCKTEDDLSAALDHFMRGESGAQEAMLSSNKCFSASSIGAGMPWVVVRNGGRFLRIRSSDNAETYWALREWLKVD